ncbi:MAG: MFS transporter [Acidimicrobiales bacterium]|nr:MFS transporter [Acidimicrobiales bacterium]
MSDELDGVHGAVGPAAPPAAGGRAPDVPESGSSVGAVPGTDPGTGATSAPPTGSTGGGPGVAAIGVAEDASGGLWAPEHRRLTGGLVLTVTLVAFEVLAIATVMPDVADDLGGLGLYGWVFSGFFLAGLVGIVLAGQLIDRRGLALPLGAGLVCFAAGLVVGALAPSMPVLIAGRALQGFGAGAIPATAYASIARGIPERLRPSMFAVLSTAWVVPGLIGPAAALGIEHALSWRWVFALLLPLVVVAAAMTVPVLRHLDAARAAERRAAARPGPRIRLGGVAALVAGATAVFVGAGGGLATWSVPLAAVGLAVAVVAARRLLPAGTLRLAPGVPATVGVRAVLTCAFFAADAYVPLAVVEGRGGPSWVAGLALTVTSITWASGSWYQARVLERVGPRRLDRWGFALIAVGAAVMVAVAAGAPVGFVVVAWAVAGAGMGTAYPALSVTVLAAAAPGQEGAASAAIQLSDVLGTVVGTGLGGALVALGDQRGWEVATSVAAVFGLSLAVALAGVAAAGRLPARVPDGPTT